MFFLQQQLQKKATETTPRPGGVKKRHLPGAFFFFKQILLIIIIIFNIYIYIHVFFVVFSEPSSEVWGSTGRWAPPSRRGSLGRRGWASPRRPTRRGVSGWGGGGGGGWGLGAGGWFFFFFFLRGGGVGVGVGWVGCVLFFWGGPWVFKLRQVSGLLVWL